MLTVSGALASKPEWPYMGSPRVCGDTLLILLTPFVGGLNGLGLCVQKCTAASLQGGQSTGVELLPTLRRWRGTLTTVLTDTSDSGKLSQSPGAPMAPQPSLICCTESCLVKK